VLFAFAAENAMRFAIKETNSTSHRRLPHSVLENVKCKDKGQLSNLPRSYLKYGVADGFDANLLPGIQTAVSMIIPNYVVRDELLRRDKQVNRVRPLVSCEILSFLLISVLPISTDLRAN
jgi:hypothetical protein